MVGAMKGMTILCRAAALALLLAASGASAQEGEVVKSLLGSIGIIPKEKAPIVYNERAPLVLPPKMELRPPVQGSVEARNPNWPKDPDVAAARKAAAEARTPYTSTELYKNSTAKPLSIEEIRAGRNPDNYNRAPTLVGGQAEKSILTPDELRAMSKNDDVKLTGGGLERRYLSDPPAGLLKAANGAPLKASEDPKVMGDPDSPHAFIRQQQNR